MKRPEGYDARPRLAEPEAEPTPRAKPKTRTKSAPQSQAARAKAEPGTRPAAADPERAARRAARERRRAERREVRRFTRRTRHRRAAWITTGVIAAVLAGLLAVAVYSPLLALTTVRVTGAQRVDAAAVEAMAEEQLGTPLALFDHDALHERLSTVPLIRSFTTQIVPPGTLVIALVERAPVGVVQTPEGLAVVDPAGVTLELAGERPAGLPLIVGSPGDEGFRSSVSVLLALPETVRGAAESVSATTRDDVTLELAGGQTVVWGSAERSALKARVLASLISASPSALEYDVSAPLSPVVRER